MAGTTALYPVVIDHAFEMFTNRDRRILYQLPALVVAITSIKAAAQYFQNVQVQQVVLLVIRELQGRMFAHLARADLARLEREAPAQLAARFTTDATVIRDSLTKAVNGIAYAVTVEPDRRGALSTSRGADPEHRPAHSPRLGRYAGADGRGCGDAERKFRTGSHGTCLPSGGVGNEPCGERLRAAVSGADAHGQGTRTRRSGAGGIGRRSGCRT